MKPFLFIFYDIKRLFGHGKTVILAVLSPVPVLLLFATFLIPFLTADSSSKVSCALFLEDDNERLAEVVNLVVTPEISAKRVVIYPVNDLETGINLVKEGKVSAFFHIPKNTYSDSRDGKKVVMEYYYSKEHSFESLIFYSSLKSTLSVFGQGIRLVYVAADIAMDKGISAEEVMSIWESGGKDLLDVHLNRGSIIGKNGVFSPGNDYYLRFILGGIFGLCTYFVSFPVMYYTSLDLSEIYSKRKSSVKNIIGFYFGRLFSGSLLILSSFLIMYPIARLIRRVPVRLAFSVFPAMLLTSLTFCSFAILLGSLFKNAHSSLWAGLYFGLISAVGVAFMTVNSELPKVISFLMEISPIRASISIFSNALFRMVEERYTMDMLVLLAAFILFTLSGFAVYLIRGCKK